MHANRSDVAQAIGYDCVIRCNDDRMRLLEADVGDRLGDQRRVLSGVELDHRRGASSTIPRPEVWVGLFSS
ncbi:hypothetical protein GFS60_06645 (plasmid) [Rhodococcus sp. WAY2]|nr:hypothetical protein GFS60_06645 [Rhodococcus sp. WAY2]